MFITITAVHISAYAINNDTQEPIKITADTAVLYKKTNTTVFSGNVIISQGSIIAHANTATGVKSNKDATVVLVGLPAKFQQMSDDGELIQGEANQIYYNGNNHTITLYQNAKIKKAKNFISGNKLIYDTDTQVFHAVSDQNHRIMVIIDPNQKN